MSALKALAALLIYPEDFLKAAAAEIGEALASEPRLTPATRARLAGLVETMASADLLDLQESYVALFDRSPKLSLHLFEHVHGDSRDRGMAMVDLATLYRGHGLEIAANELPDYLPLFLEFLSQLPAAEAAPLLADASPVLGKIEGRLEGRGSAYAAVFAALREIAGTAAETAPEAPVADDDSLEALDRAWEEAAVTFGPEPPGAAAGCGRASAMLERMNMPQGRAEP